MIITGNGAESQEYVNASLTHTDCPRSNSQCILCQHLRKPLIEDVAGSSTGDGDCPVLSCSDLSRVERTALLHRVSLEPAPAQAMSLVVTRQKTDL